MPMFHTTPYQAMRRCRDHLQRMPWLSLVGYGILAMLYCAIASLFLPTAWQAGLKRAFLVLPLLLLIAKDLACYPLSLQRLRIARAHGAPWRRCVSVLLPPELFAWMRLERAMWHGFLNTLLRRQPAARPPGTALGYLERGAYGTAMCVVLLALLVEMPLDLLIGSVMATTPHQARTLHIVFGLLAAYSGVWILGDRWHVLGRRHHLLTATALELDIGARARGTVALEAIARCERLDESRAAWCQRHGYPLHVTRKVSPWDAPNIVLVLKPGCDVQLTVLQLARDGDSPIFLYVDHPEQLCALMSGR